MIVRFLGVREKSTTGCTSCGGKRTYMSFKRIKTYTMPSGKSYTFRVGQTRRVSTQDGQFLLQQSQPAGVSSNPVFEEVIENG